MNDLLDRIRDTLSKADTNTWITAVIVAVVVQLLVLLILRVVGIFFRMASWIFASAISVVIAIWILDNRGIPNSIGGKRIEEWIDDIRNAIGV